LWPRFLFCFLFGNCQKGICLDRRGWLYLIKTIFKVNKFWSYSYLFRLSNHFKMIALNKKRQLDWILSNPSKVNHILLFLFKFFFFFIFGRLLKSDQVG
jgi:hypothetical protein